LRDRPGRAPAAPFSVPIFGWFRTFGTVLFLFLGYPSEISEWSTPARVFLVCGLGMATAAKLGEAILGAVAVTDLRLLLKICLKAYAIRPLFAPAFR
jgi:hypothetical protein